MAELYNKLVDEDKAKDEIKYREALLAHLRIIEDLLKQIRDSK